MGSLLEHAYALLLFGCFALATSAQLVLQQGAYRSLPLPLTLLLAQLGCTTALARAAAANGLLPNTGAEVLSARRAAQAAPDAVAHTLLSLAQLLSLGKGSVEAFLAVTAACVPPLACFADSLLAGAAALPTLSHKQRQAAVGGTAAAAVALLAQAPWAGLVGPVLLLALWLTVFLADKAWTTLRAAPLLPPAKPLAEAGEESAPGPETGLLARAHAIVHSTCEQLAMLTAPPAAAASGELALPQPPSPFERVLYGNALPLPLLAVGVLLSGELLSLELTIPALSALLLSALATAVSSVAVLLLAETQALRAARLLRATAGCNAAALLLNALVSSPPRVGLLGRGAALAAVASGAYFLNLELLS